MLGSLICVLGVAACDRPSSSTSSTTTTTPPAENRVVVTDQPTTQPRNDNTAINERDRAADAKTAGVQGQTKTDVELTAEIRKQVMATQLSSNAKNSNCHPGRESHTCASCR